MSRNARYVVIILVLIVIQSVAKYMYEKGYIPFVELSPTAQCEKLHSEVFGKLTQSPLDNTSLIVQKNQLQELRSCANPEFQRRWALTFHLLQASHFYFSDQPKDAMAELSRLESKINSGKASLDLDMGAVLNQVFESTDTINEVTGFCSWLSRNSNSLKMLEQGAAGGLDGEMAVTLYRLKCAFEKSEFENINAELQILKKLRKRLYDDYPEEYSLHGKADGHYFIALVMKMHSCFVGVCSDKVTEDLDKLAQAHDIYFNSNSFGNMLELTKLRQSILEQDFSKARRQLEFFEVGKKSFNDRQTLFWEVEKATFYLLTGQKEGALALLEQIINQLSSSEKFNTLNKKHRLGEYVLVLKRFINIDQAVIDLESIPEFEILAEAKGRGHFLVLRLKKIRDFLSKKASP